MSTITPQKKIKSNAANYNTEKVNKKSIANRPKSSTMNIRGRKKQKDQGYMDLSYRDPPQFDSSAKGMAFGPPKSSQKNFKTIH